MSSGFGKWRVFSAVAPTVMANERHGLIQMTMNRFERICGCWYAHGDATPDRHSCPAFLVRDYHEAIDRAEVCLFHVFLRTLSLISFLIVAGIFVSFW
jgi:hypothetical protein